MIVLMVKEAENSLWGDDVCGVVRICNARWFLAHF